MDGESRAWQGAIAHGADAVVLALTWAGCVGLRAAVGDTAGLPPVPIDAVASLGWLIVPLWLAILALRRTAGWRPRSGSRLLVSTAVATLLALLLLFLARIEINRTLLLGFAASAVPALWIADRGVRRLAWLTRVQPHRIALVGDVGPRQRLLRALEREPGVVVILGLDVAALSGLEDRLAVCAVDEVFVAGALPMDALGLLARVCEAHGLPLSLDATFMGLRTSTVELRDLQGWSALTLSSAPGASAERLAKRAIDIVGATVSLVVLGFPLLGLMLAVTLHDGGPALFVQERVGRYGRRFRMLKLRTMVLAAEAQRPLLQPLNEVDGPAFKLRDDPRVTRLGRWLRRTSLDELPQLLNVLVGQMSLVGPRPPLPEEVASYAPEQRRRLSVRPGMTGLWQVSGRSDLPFERWMALDLHYVDNWSLWLDLSVLARTLPAVVEGRGAR